MSFGSDIATETVVLDAERILQLHGVESASKETVEIAQWLADTLVEVAALKARHTALERVTEEQVERVAKEFCEEEYQRDPHYRVPWNELDEDGHEWCRFQVRWWHEHLTAARGGG